MLLAPTKALPNGTTIPVFGLGTQDMVNWEDAERIGKSCAAAMKMGYRHFDCAPAYQNHKAVGKHLRAALEETGIKRSEIFVTSKLANDGHTKVREHLLRTLGELGLDYLDCYLIHWPWPNYHPPGCHGDYINPESRHYDHSLYMETYRELEKAYEEGLVKNIGVSNMTVPKMKLVLRDCKVKPACNQVEIHLHFQQEALLKWHQEQGIAVVGYFPLGSPGRADRDKASHHTVPMQDPSLVRIAEAKKISAAQLALKFQMQRGVVVIPQSANPVHQRANLESALLPDLSAEEMKELQATDKNIRFIAGQVFNWKKGMDWHDLWDDLGKETWEGPINGAQAQERPAEPNAAVEGQPCKRARMGEGVARRPFGKCEDGETELFTLRNANNYSVAVTNYGAAIVELWLPGRDGSLADCVLGFDSIDGYLGPDNSFFGATVGRVANRTAGGKFTVDGKEYQGAITDGAGPNLLHGGKKGFDKVLWSAEVLKGDAQAVKFTYVAKDGEENYPGECSTSVTYTLTAANFLVIDMRSTVTKRCPVNLANHAYFNLAGHKSGDILGHQLHLNAEQYTPVDGHLIPTGEVLLVKGTTFDFLATGQEAHTIGERIDALRGLEGCCGGYDHNYVLRQAAAGEELRLAATVVEPKSGRRMEIRTNRPGVQFYSGNFLGAGRDGASKGKDGGVYNQHQAFCLETHNFPNSANQAVSYPIWPSIVLEPGQEYVHRMDLHFGTV